MPSFRSALQCEHANEMPATCPCPSDCYCKAHACRHPERRATHPPQAALPTPPKNESDAFRMLGQFPHCDPRVLHKPGDCEYCDGHPEWQALRMVYGINFTGEGDPKKAECPAERHRAAHVIHRWGGNRPTNANPPVEGPSRYERDLDAAYEAIVSDDKQFPETD